MRNIHAAANAIIAGLREEGFARAETQAHFEEHGILAKFAKDIDAVYSKAEDDEEESEKEKPREKKKGSLTSLAEEYVKEYIKDLARRAREGDEDAHDKLKEMRDNGLVQAELACDEIEREKGDAKPAEKKLFPKKPGESTSEAIAMVEVPRALKAWLKLTPEQRSVLSRTQTTATQSLADQMLDSRRRAR